MAIIKEEYTCSLLLVIDLIGGKWKQRILWHIIHGDNRFSLLQKGIPDITGKMLTTQLKELEVNGLVEPTFKFAPTGMFHFSVQDPDIEGLIEEIVKHGGKQRMPIREYYPNEKTYKMCYVEDPFGIVFEIYTHSYEVTYSSGAY